MPSHRIGDTYASLDLARQWLAEANAVKTFSPWSYFALQWFAFNALYNVHQGGNERQRVLRSVRTYFESGTAPLHILEQVQDFVDKLAKLPPGNDRLSPASEDYRQESADDLKVVQNKRKPPEERLARLLGVTYIVRCNLLHGNKCPSHSRDQDIVNWCNQILAVVLPAMLRTHH